MNLLMISGDRSLTEGKHGAFYNTLEEFHKHWERIDIITPRITNYELRITNIFDNVFIHSSPWPLWLQPFWIYREGLRILKNGNWKLENDNWVITCHDYPPFYNGLGARLLWNKIKVPYLLEIMHIPGYPRAGGFKEWFYKQYAKIFVRFDAKKAKAVRVINHKQVPEFLAKYGVPKDKFKYIPAFYIDLNIFKPLNLEKKYDIIFVGRLTKNKGIELFLKVAKTLSLRTLIVGDGPLKKYIDKKIKEWKLENVKCFGWAKDSSEIASLINKSRLLIMPSLNEGGPRVVVEAMACGVPVLATPVGIVPDLLKNDSGGEIIAWNAEDIILKTRGLLNDPDRYDKLSNEAVEIVKQFEKKSAIENYAKKIKQLIIIK